MSLSRSVIIITLALVTMITMMKEEHLTNPRVAYSLITNKHTQLACRVASPIHESCTA
jgi:hypothetical protein